MRLKITRIKKQSGIVEVHDCLISVSITYVYHSLVTNKAEWFMAYIHNSHEFGITIRKEV